jgi:hypothetical protein
MKFPPMLKTVHEQITKTLKESPKLIWINDQPTKDDLDHIIKEGSEPSEFDPDCLRKEMLDALKNNKAILITRTSRIAKVLVITYTEEESQIPWNLFGEIFTAFGENKPMWRLVWFANPKIRPLPEKSVEVTAKHMNGGYAYPCQPATIVIYRWEEAPRVLIHELLHAACTDSPHDSLEIKEAKTETWAEIFLTAILSRGKPKLFKELWSIQTHWIADQEYVLTHDHGVREPRDYAWRYTLARRFVLKEFGCDLPEASVAARDNLAGSMRFTSPSLQ